MSGQPERTSYISTNFFFFFLADYFLQAPSLCLQLSFGPHPQLLKYTSFICLPCTVPFPLLSTVQTHASNGAHLLFPSQKTQLFFLALKLFLNLYNTCLVSILPACFVWSLEHLNYGCEHDYHNKKHKNSNKRCFNCLCIIPTDRMKCYYPMVVFYS